MTKLQKLENEAQKVRAKIDELQDSLKDIDKQRVDLENAYIVQMVRASKMTPQELYELLKKGALPSTLENSDTNIAENNTDESEDTQHES